MSLHHALDHLRLDRAVSKVLSVEVLRLVSHAMTPVANDWNFDFRLIGSLRGLGGVHGDLVASRHLGEAILGAGVSD